MQTEHRIARLRNLLEESQIDALIVTNLLNIRYLTGFSGSAASLVILSGASSEANYGLLCTDGRYSEQAQKQLDQATTKVALCIGNPNLQLQESAKLISNYRKIGIEKASTTLAVMEKWEAVLRKSPLPVTNQVESLRRFKDPDELELVRQAAQIADSALHESLPRLKDHPSEIEFAAELEYQMRSKGADGIAFETIVASGSNSAMPHARPTRKIIQERDSVVIDYGAVVGGYHSDCTRTYFVGDNATQQFKSIYDAVASAQQLGALSVAENIPAAQIDQVCRDSLSQAGLSQYFTHGTGHGVGLEIHEAPWISPGEQTPLELGDVITVEPGVYLRGDLGVRIEDTIALTAQGPVTLTNVLKDPIIG